MKHIAIDVLERHTRGGTWSLDTANGDVWWSAGIYALYGVTPATYTPTLDSSLEFYERESAEWLRDAISRAVDNGEGWSTTVVLRRADGVRRFVHAVGRVQVRDNQAPLLAGALIDVHEQTLERRARENTSPANESQGERWRIAAELVGLSLLEIDFERSVYQVTGMIARLLSQGSATDLIIERDDWQALIHPDDRMLYVQRLDGCRAGAFSYHACEYRLCPPGVSEIHVSETGRLVRDDSGERLVGTLTNISDRVRAERAIQASRERLIQTLDNAPIGMALIAPDGRWVSVNRALCRMLGYTEAELLRTSFQSVSHPDDVRVGYEGARAMLAGRADTHQLHKRYIHRNGDTIDVQLDTSLLRDTDSKPLYFITHVQNVTERKRAERALFDAKTLADVTFEAIGEGVIRVDRHGVITQINPAACAMVQTTAADALGRSFSDIVVLFESECNRRMADPIAEVFATGERIRAPLFTRLQGACDGRQIAIVDSASPVHDPQGMVCGAVFVFRDVSDVSRMTDELDHLARHDSLTGLLNRRGFEQALDQSWPAVGESSLPLYVMYLDVDHFKAINDLSGHLTGDEMLRQIAIVMRETLTESDVIGRVGGDEFAAVVHVADHASAETLATSLLARVRSLYYSLDGRRHHASASIGIAAAGASAADWDSAFMRADAALYLAKEAGRNRCQLYGVAADHSSLAADYLNTTQMLQAGFDQNFFVLHLQAIVDAQSRLLGFEALLRYDDGHGIVMPDLLLPTAKRLGMMGRIDRWAISSVLELIRDAQQAGHWFDGCYISINVSPLTLADPDFHGELTALLDQYPDQAGHVAFEIIESDALFGQYYARIVADLRARNIRVWLDDFARGYNSFDTLKRIGVDGIKIDRSFVQDIDKDPIDRTVLRSVGDISTALSLSVVAEGVENVRMLELLIKAGFTQFQGYYFHRPQKASEALKFFTR